jgi:hypothetical protein
VDEWTAPESLVGFTQASKGVVQVKTQVGTRRNCLAHLAHILHRRTLSHEYSAAVMDFAGRASCKLQRASKPGSGAEGAAQKLGVGNNKVINK